LRLEVLFTLEGLDFRAAGEEYRVELDRAERVLPLEVVTANASSRRRVVM